MWRANSDATRLNAQIVSADNQDGVYQIFPLNASKLWSLAVTHEDSERPRGEEWPSLSGKKMPLSLRGRRRKGYRRRVWEAGGARFCIHVLRTNA